MHPRRYATRTYGGSPRPPYSRSTTFEPKRHRHPLGVQMNHNEHRPPSLRPDSPSKVCQAESTQAMPQSTLQARVGPKAPRASQPGVHPPKTHDRNSIGIDAKLRRMASNGIDRSREFLQCQRIDSRSNRIVQYKRLVAHRQQTERYRLAFARRNVIVAASWHDHNCRQRF